MRDLITTCVVVEQNSHVEALTVLKSILPCKVRKAHQQGKQGTQGHNDYAILRSAQNDGKRAAFTKPSRGTNEARDEHQSTETLSFRCWCERCRLMRGAAFTLAEVLITLGIIGVVAAMTIPTVMNNYQKKVAINQFKKIYSTLENAQSRATVDYGVPEYWDYGTSDTSEEFMEKYYIPYLKVLTKGASASTYSIKNLNGDDLGTWKSPKGLTKYHFFTLQDGTNIRYYFNGQYFVISADVNGAKGPNVFGKDIWDFELYWDSPKKLEPLGMYAGKNPSKVTEIFNRCKNFAQASGSGCSCSGLLIYNSYKIDDNYPW